MSDLIENLPPIAPLNFFELSLNVKYGKNIAPSKWFGNSYVLPTMDHLLAEESFADVSMAWNETGLLFGVHFKKQFEEAMYPQYQKGDAVELFIDTRDMKSARFPTRFCHHFLILPKEVQEITAQELSRFRTDDTHPLCEASDIVSTTEFTSKDFRMQIALPAHILHGYDPASFDRIGFTYRINRHKGAPQHFALSSDACTLEQNPSLWASLSLRK